MTSKNKANLISRLVGRRIWVQAAFLFLWLDPFFLRLHNICGPVFHCYSCPLATFACPIGVVANFSALHVFPFFAVGILLVVGALLGSFICGWVCPFGLFQDVIGRIPTPKFELPVWTTHVRYVVLVALVLAVPFFLGEAHPLFICRVCPTGALEGAVPNMVQQAMSGQNVVWPGSVKITIVVAILAAMLFTWRPWCTVFCPLGAIFTLCDRVLVFFIRFDASDCNACGKCRRLCRYGVAPDERVSDPCCVRCLECTDCQALVATYVFASREASPRPEVDVRES